MTSTERSVMRLASSWMVITSGMITSRMTLSRGCTTPAWRSFSRSRRRRSEASERSRCASSKALLMVSLMRSRRSSPILTGLLGGLAPFFLARDSSSASASTSRARAPRLATARRAAALRRPWLSRPFAPFGLDRRLDRHAPARPYSSCGSATGGAGSAFFSISSGSGSTSAAAAPPGARARPLPPRRAPWRLRARAGAHRARRWRDRQAAASPRRAGAPPPPARPFRRSAPPGPEIVRFFFFSTTTDFDRPWLKLCLTWPASTVRFRLNGLRGAAPRNVFSVASFVSVMHVLCWFMLAGNRQPSGLGPADIAQGAAPLRLADGSRRPRPLQHVSHLAARWPSSIRHPPARG